MASHASSSMANAQACFSYDVFLSFRGKDTRDGFTDHLYTALNQAGIRAFRDDDRIERGKLMKPELKKAIHESTISLIVFSKSYASSTWCLDEVMMSIKEHETSSFKHQFVPVFYKVEPSAVRNQTESFKEAFDAYDDKIKAETDLEKKTELLEKVGAWRESLNKSATFTGLVYKDGYESNFINDIVNVIRKKLDYKSLYIEEKLVGIEDNVAKIESWLQDPSPDAVVLLIDGMGGVGKSTIAKCIYNSNSRKYDGSCFLANINEISNQPSGLIRLQSQLLSTILQSEKEETIWNVHEGSNKITKAISNKKDGRVMMHQLIKEMGREVVRKESPKDPGKRSRLWRHQDCIDVLQDRTGTKKVEGLMIDMQKSEEVESTSATMINNPRKRSLEEYLGKKIHGNDADFNIVALEKMNNLMLLQLNYVTFSGRCKKLPRKLRLLRWHGCTLKTIPSESCLEKLVVLDMSHSKLKCVWDDFKFIGSIKVLNLSYSVELTKTPNFSGLPGLESLILKGCSSLIKVDESIAYLNELVLLDLTDCTNLREFPSFPTSLVSIQMSGCGVVGQVQSLDLVPSLSALVEMDISNCNLFEILFPNDWSSLVSLVDLNISGNNVITSLPKCIQTLPRVQCLTVANCSKIQSISLPKSVLSLIVSCNESLETIKLNRSSPVVDGKCQKLCAMDGRRKVKSIDKVEKQIIQYMGLESNAGEGMKLGLQVLHEFGIFSTCVSGTRIPSGFMDKERPPQISFKVPWRDDSLRISGLSMCVALSRSSGSDFFSFKVNVYNKTKDSLFTYYRGRQEIITENVENYAWLGLWRCGDPLEGGDEIVVSIMEYEGPSLRKNVEECCINLIYEDMMIIDHLLEG